MANTKQWEEGYVQGFYTALQGVRWVATQYGTAEAVLKAVDEAVEEMRADGDLDNIDTRVDELLKIATYMDEQGMGDQFFDTLDNFTKQIGKNK